MANDVVGYSFFHNLCGNVDKSFITFRDVLSNMRHEPDSEIKFWSVSAGIAELIAANSHVLHFAATKAESENSKDECAQYFHVKANT